MLKKVISVFLCGLIFVTMLSGIFTTNAAVVKKGTLTIATIDAKVGDSVILPINLKDNPGIMAVSISITYDSDYLQYEEFVRGEVISDYMVVDHPTKKLIRLVSLCRRNTTNDGVFISFKFKVKDNAPMGLLPVSIEYGSGDFCNKELDRLMPTIVKGGINVAYNGSNCPHKEYGDWSVATPPSCDNVGYDQRICKSCGHTDLKEIAPIGHEYPDSWVITKEATPEEYGTMARLCIRCQNPVDEILFPYKDVEDGKLENEEDKIVIDKDYAEDKFTEQNPGKKPTPAKPEINTSSEITSSDENDLSTDEELNENENITPDSDSDHTTDEEAPENKKFEERIKATMEKILEVVPQAEKITDFYKSLFYFILLALFI